MSLAELLRLVLAAAVLVWSVSDARRQRAALPPVPIAGAPIDAPPAPRTRDAAPTVTGAGTPAAPARVPFACFTFVDYDPAPLRLDRTPLGPDEFPPPLPALDGKVVRVEGYPLVLEAVDGVVEKLLLTRFPPGCCFGTVPVLDEWIGVTLERVVDAAGVVGTRPAVATGRLEVGERLSGDGRVESIYRLRAARLEPADG